MSYTLKENYANPNNFGGERNLSDIKFIVIHYTANDGDTDENNGKYFHNNIVNASAHYFVDSDSVTRSVADNFVAWSVGGGKYGDCAKTGGGKYYGICNNTNSISIELCDDYRNGVVKATQATIDNAVELTRFLMVKYGIPEENVIRHFDVNGKHCPAYWMDNNAWYSEFKSKLSASKGQTGAIPYRVRKTWADASSQIGAYNVYDNAISACLDGYTVFDNMGNVCYTKTVASVPVVETPTVSVAPTVVPHESIHAYYAVIADGKRYPEVVDDSDYAGVNERRNVQYVGVGSNHGYFRYRVHTLNGRWLPWVTSYNLDDLNNGCAGNGQNIDGFQCEYITPSGEPIKYAYSQVSVRGNEGFLPWVRDCEDFCGIFGRIIDGIRIKVA